MADTKHPSFPQPADPNIAVWRYMDLAKFLWILQNRALYFTRSDCLGDPFEGYPTKALILGRQSYIDFITAQSPKASGDVWGEHFDRLITFMKAFRYGCYVSCWHANNEESAAMWKLYTRLSEAICIKTTYTKLSESLPESVFLGVVTYIDYDQHTFTTHNMLNAIVHKRSSFAHEKEVRAVFPSMTDLDLEDEAKNKSSMPVGKIVPTNLKTLIEEVYISPDSAPYLLDLVKGVLEKYEIHVPVKQSGVNAPPAY